MAQETYKGLPVYTRRLPGGRGTDNTYVKATVYCHGCGKAIPGTRTVSRNTAGVFSTLQTFVPDSKTAHLLKAKGRKYSCGEPKCSGDQKVKKDQPKAEPVSPEPQSHEGKVTFKGPGGAVFVQKGEEFFYRGFKIVGGYVECEHTCEKCQGTIKTKAYVSYKDGKPAYVNKQTVLGAAAKSIPKGSKSVWEHIECPTEKTEPLGISPSVEAVLTAENEALRIEIDRLNQETSGALELAVDLEKQLNTVKEELASAYDLLKQAKLELDKVALHTNDLPSLQGAMSLLVAGKPHQDLERMALDPSVSDKAVRGASWMLMRAIQGGGR